MPRFLHPRFDLFGDELFDRLAEKARESRRVPVRRDRDRDAAAPQDASRVSARVRGIVHGVDEDAALVRGRRNPSIHFGCGRRHDVPGSVQVARLEAPAEHDRGRAIDFGSRFRGDDRHRGSGVQESAELRRRHLSPADDHHAATAELQEDREHRGLRGHRTASREDCAAPKSPLSVSAARMLARLSCTGSRSVHTRTSGLSVGS